jgi:excisionase family DNA binding protein
MLDLPEGQMLFTMQEVTQYLRISIASVHRWRKDGKLRAHKVGRNWRVSREELQRVGGGRAHETPEPFVRRAWFQSVRRSYAVAFVELYALALAKDGQDPAEVRKVLDELTPEELRVYCDALQQVQAIAQEMLAEVPEAESEGSSGG